VVPRRINLRPPIFGMIERGGVVVIWMMESVQQTTSKPLRYGSKGSLIMGDEYSNLMIGWEQIDALIAGLG